MNLSELDTLTPRELTRRALDIRDKGPIFSTLLDAFTAKYGYSEGTYKLAIYTASVLTAIRSQRICEIAESKT